MTPSPAGARLCLVLAAVLWSTSGLFVRVLQQPTPLGLESPPLGPSHIAVFRSLFAGLGLILFVRRADVRLRPAMLGLVVAFGTMTGLFVTALSLGSSANAILLQNTAPVWVYLIGVWLLGQTTDRRGRLSVVLGLLGAVVIVAGNWPRGQSAEERGTQGDVLLLATGSGLFYALVILLLGRLNRESPVWLTMWNLVGSAVLIAGVVAVYTAVTKGPDAVRSWFLTPTAAQLAYLAAFGMFQMAAPYVLFARGLKAVSPQEAGIITLLEPVLNPVWAYLIAPDRETPTVWTFAGGGLLLAALLWRYLPTGRRLPTG